MELINLTPHRIVLRGPDGDTVLESSGEARVDSSPGREWKWTGTPVPVHDAPEWGLVQGLPAPRWGVLLIVSAIVASRCAGRADVVSPGTGPKDGAIREGGQVVAVTRLIAAPQKGAREELVSELRDIWESIDDIQTELGALIASVEDQS